MMAAAYLPYIMRDPSTQTYRRGVAQPGSAPPWGGGGRRFKSSRPDQHPCRGVRIPGPSSSMTPGVRRLRVEPSRPDQHFVPLLVITSSLRSHATSAEDVAFIPGRRARASQAFARQPEGARAGSPRVAHGTGTCRARPARQRREAQEKRAIRGVFLFGDFLLDKCTDKQEKVTCCGSATHKLYAAAGGSK